MKDAQGFYTEGRLIDRGEYGGWKPIGFEPRDCDSCALGYHSHDNRVETIQGVTICFCCRRMTGELKK